MFGQYQQYVSGSEEEASHSQTLSFPGAYSIKKKAVPLHRKIRNSKNTNRVLKPLRIIYTSPENLKSSDLNNTSQESDVFKETFVDNSLENIQEVPENGLKLNNNLFPTTTAHDPLEDLFPSGNSKLSECSSTSQMDLSEITDQGGQNMEVNTPVINNVTNFSVLEDIGNQRDVLYSKIKSDIRKTPLRPNLNRDINAVCKKDAGNNDKENNKNISSYHRFTTAPHDVLITACSIPLQPVSSCSAVSSKAKNKNIPVNGREICSNKKIEFRTPNRVPGDLRSEYMKPPPPIPQMKLPEQKMQNFLIINGKNYEIQSLLGRGGSSKVYQVQIPGTSNLMAVKEVDLSMVESSITQGYLQEIDLLRKLQSSESVIRMIDCEYVEEREKLYVVMEKGETDLSKLIKEITKVKQMPIPTVVYYWNEMLRAVKDIHEKNVIHSDLKPANFLLVCGRLKLIDFGIASSVQNDVTSVYKDVQTGTFNYISPEALQVTSNDKNGVIKISYKSDIWSLGCILYNLLYGKTPFQHIVPQMAKFLAITNKNHCIEYPSTRKDCPPILIYAVKRCLTFDPKKRPTAAELLELPYFNLLAPESCLPG